MNEASRTAGNFTYNLENVPLIVGRNCGRIRLQSNHSHIRGIHCTYLKQSVELHQHRENELQEQKCQFGVGILETIADPFHPARLVVVLACEVRGQRWVLQE